MSEVRFSTAAQSDLLDIVVFIARDNPRAAEDWLAAIEERCRLLADHPLTGEQRPGFGVAGCRSVSAGAYVIFFRPMPTATGNPLPSLFSPAHFGAAFKNENGSAGCREPLASPL
jgi:toxin ParE1/3/4